MPNNRMLYFKVKPAFQKIWSNLPADLPCKDCTLETLAHAMADMMAEHNDKVRSASVMVQALWHATTEDPAQNPAPKFSYNYLLRRSEAIQRDRYQRKNVNVNGNGNVNKNNTSAQADSVGLEKQNHNKEEEMTKSKKKPMVNTPIKHSVTQIDPATLKPIETFQSISAASKKTGARNIDRAILKHGKAAGFYWCEAGDEENFKPKEITTGRKSVAKSPSPSMNHSPITPGKKSPDASIILSSFSDQDLIAEMKRRGWKGNIAITMNVEL